jgi:hypothetical protein
VAVIPRNDSNYHEVVNSIVETIKTYLAMKPKQIAATREAAVELALKAEWQHFICHYREAYTIALKKSLVR